MTQTANEQRMRDRSHLRTVANNLALHLHPPRVPAAALRFSYTWGLGGISILLVAILFCTGVLLVFRYEPSVNTAYLSIQAIETKIFFGSLIRAMHHWSANLLLVAVFLHLLRVFFTGGFKQGRGGNWAVGVALLLIVVAFNFTGYLLPWDQLAYWAITVATSLVSYVPLVGSWLQTLLLSGTQVGQATLSNFYAIHVALLPFCLLATITYHLWKIRKSGGISQPVLLAGERRDSLTTIPHLVEREMAAAAVVFAGILLWAIFTPAPLADHVDPTASPNPAKAAWYFLGIQELLLHMHPLAAMILLSLLLVMLLLLPLLERRSSDVGIYFRSAVGKRTALVSALLSINLTPLLVVVDEFWLNLPAVWPALPVWISNGFLPLLFTLAGLATIYLLIRVLLKANHSEATLGLFTFLFTSLILLTITGIYFRGPNMALTLPF